MEIVPNHKTINLFDIRIAHATVPFLKIKKFSHFQAHDFFHAKII
jgi:hypothetical protein